MDYEITDYITPEEYMEMRKLVGWTDFPMEQAEQGLKHTAHLCVFRKDGKVIALARVLTDHGYVVYIADVIVDEKYRGKGIGKKLISTIVSDNRFSNLLGLLVTRDAHGLYEQFGFVKDSERAMTRRI